MFLWMWGRRAVLVACAACSASLLHPPLDDHLFDATGAASVATTTAPMRRVASFTRAFVAAGVSAPGAIESPLTHEALGAALGSRIACGTLGRTPCVALFVTTPRSLLDTEAYSLASAAAASSEHPLELPSAFLAAVHRGAVLPQLSVVLSVEFTPGAAFLAGEKRCTIRRCVGCAGLFHATVRMSSSGVWIRLLR